MSDVVREHPVVYNYRDERLVDLNESIDIVEELNFSKLNKLTFEYPYWLIDSFGVIERDENGDKIRNPKVDFIQNEAIVKFKGRHYVIKKDYDNRTLSRDIYLRIECEDMGYELTEKIVDYLDLTPPINDPQTILSALREVVVSGQIVRTSRISAVGAGTITLDSNASNSDDFYNGYTLQKLNLGGTGSTSTIITDYNGTTKVATVVSTSGFSADDEYRIWNQTWTIGTIDSSFDIGNRSHKIEFQTIYEAISKVLARYPNSDGNVGKLSFDISYNQTTGRWEKVINIVDANPFAGAEFRYRENIKDVSREQDTSQIYTRISPEGTDNLRINSIGNENRTDSGVTYLAHQSGYNYIDNFQYYLAQGYTYKECLDNFVKEYRYYDDVYVDPQDLYDDSFSLIDNFSMPKITYSVSAVNLSKIFDGKYLDFSIGDTVRIFDDEINLEIFTTIERLVISENEPWNSRVELTNFNDNLSDVIKNIIEENNSFASKQSLYGKESTFIIADQDTSPNVYYADFYVPSGSKNAEYYINRALDSLDGGGIVSLLEGEYRISNNINITKSNTTLEGVYGKTIIRSMNNSLTGINVNGTELSPLENIIIKNIISTTGGSYSSTYFTNAVTVNYSNNVEITSNIIKNVYNNSIIVFGGGNSVIKDNIFEDDAELLSKTSFNDIIDIKNSNSSIISSNKLNASAFRGINVEENSGVGANLQGDYSIDSNTFSPSNITYCFFINDTYDDVAGKTVANVEIKNNKILSDESVSIVAGVWNSRNVVFDSNYIDGVFKTARGIEVNNSKNCIFSNNEFHMRQSANLSSRAIFDIVNSSEYNEITKNVFSDNVKVGNDLTSYPYGYLIADDATTSTTVIAGNSFIDYTPLSADITANSPIIPYANY